MMTLETIDTIKAQNKSKLEQAKRYIQAQGYVNSWLIGAIALDLEISTSTAYKAKRELLQMGAINSKGLFIGCFIEAETIAEHFDNMPKIADIDELAKKLYSNSESIYTSLQLAKRCQLIKAIGSSSYGIQYTRVQS